MRECGMLLPVASLPSKYGIGAFSKEAYEFIDIGCLFISFRQMECLSEFS